MSKEREVVSIDFFRFDAIRLFIREKRREVGAVVKDIWSHERKSYDYSRFYVGRHCTKMVIDRINMAAPNCRLLYKELKKEFPEYAYYEGVTSRTIHIYFRGAPAPAFASMYALRRI